MPATTQRPATASPFGPPAPDRLGAAHPADDRGADRTLDSRLTSAAEASARCLGPVAAGWDADDLCALAHAAALVGLKRELRPDAFEDLRRQYREHRTAYLAQLRPRADC